MSADLQSFVKGRKLDDNVHILLRFQGGARGMLWASQVAVGNENGLQLRVYGEKAGLEWRQDNPNYMWFTEFGKPKQLLTRGGAMVSEKHCNFLINTGEATASDIEGLGEEVRRRVFETSGIALEWEIRRIGVSNAPVARDVAG